MQYRCFCKEFWRESFGGNNLNKYLEVDEYNEVVNNSKAICELMTEMTDSQLGFLCGLIRDKRPSKVLEVGVAAGGTTLVILQCAKELNLNMSLYSVDLNNRYYCDGTKETGYISKEIEKSGEYCSIDHHYMLGNYLPQVLLDVGKEIDFLILDTVHHLPGELLDFLATLPFLANEAIVVLHDVSLQHEEATDKYCYATQVLFSCVKGTKYLNNNNGYPNIAAFRVEKDCLDNINDIFSALTLTWNYMPREQEINIYRSWYEKYYGEFSLRIFGQAVKMNINTLSMVDNSFKDYMQTLCNAVLCKYDYIYFYGAGKRGQAFRRALYTFWDVDRVDKCRYLVSEADLAKDNGFEIWNNINYSENLLIVVTADSQEIKDKLRNSEFQWIDIPKQIWNDLERVYKE